MYDTSEIANGEKRKLRVSEVPPPNTLPTKFNLGFVVIALSLLNEPLIKSQHFGTLMLPLSEIILNTIIS